MDGEMRDIAALFVEKNGTYYGLEGVHTWSEAEDARTYTGPYPVVAHPPCQRWGSMWAGSTVHIARTGQRYEKGDDGGCFEAALIAARQFGGVIEHPYPSHAWPHFNIPRPPRKGGWIDTPCGGKTCCVEQGRYGHYARKPTYLLVYKADPPELNWGHSPPSFPAEAIEKFGLEKCKKMGEMAFLGGGKDNRYRVATPEPFRDLLISIARSVEV